MTQRSDREADDGSRDNGGVPWDSRAVYIIFSCSLIGVMGVSMISPVLPELRDVFGVTDGEVGLVITAYTLPGILLSPFVGLVADRLGRRRVVVPLLFVFGGAGASIAFVDSFGVVLLLRAVQGVGASGLVAMAVTLIGDLYTGGRKDAVLGLNGSSISAGAAVYPFIGGALAAVRWSLPFLFFGVAVLIGLLALVALPEPERGEKGTSVRGYVRGLADVLRRRETVGLYVATFSALLLFYGSVLTAVPLLLNDEFGLGSARIGPILSMTAVASAIVSSQYERIAGVTDKPGMISLGFCIYGVSLIGLWLAPSPVAVAAVLLLFGSGNVITLLSIDNSIVTMAPDGMRAGMMGVRTSAFRLGQTVGPVAFTFTAEALFVSPVDGYRTLFAVSGAVTLVAGLIAYLSLR